MIVDCSQRQRVKHSEHYNPKTSIKILRDYGEHHSVLVSIQQRWLAYEHHKIHQDRGFLKPL